MIKKSRKMGRLPNANTNNEKENLCNEKGAIDLASIMVGIIVIGLVGGVIAATVFAIIPWAQDNAAKQQLDSVSSAQSAYMGLTSSVPSGLPEGHTVNSYAASDKLEAAGLLKSDGKSYCVITIDDGKDYQAIAKSSSSSLFSITSKNTQPTFFTGVLPEDCGFLTPDGTNPAGPKNTITTLTYLCDANPDGTAVTRTGTVPMQDNIKGKLSIKSGAANEERNLDNEQNSGAITMQSGVTYTVTLDGTYNKFSSDTTQISSDTTQSSSQLAPCLRSLDTWGKDTGVTDAGSGLMNATNLVSVPSKIPSTVTSLSRFFQGAVKFNDPNVATWNTGNISNMEFLFSEAAAFNQSLNNWDVSKANNMRWMFQSATAFNQPLNSWDTSKVTNMYHMFSEAAAFNQPLNDWDVSGVFHMQTMFNMATSFDQPLNEWDTSNVTNMYGMFSGAISFNQSISSWDTSKVTNMSRMFFDATKFSQNLSMWKTNSLKEGNSFAKSPLMTKSYLPAGTALV